MKTIETIQQWGLANDKSPIAIAGPCSAETREQVLATAEGLHQAGVRLFRVGVWKPRTRPGGFEGAGIPALSWLKEVKEKYGMKLAVEVATKEHVLEAIKAGIDIFWIGARTTVSPFAVQEIADSLKGMDIPIMIKNPVNPDIALWMGAFERLEAVGIKKLIALHRGFSGFSNSTYRNDPHWQLPLEFRIKCPDVPMVCDPSHIAGKRDLVEAVCQQALDLGFDGLMIESHCSPDEALSDSAQQITPQTLKHLLSTLKVRKENAPNREAAQKLKPLRDKIDILDNELLSTLAKRMEVVRQIADIKKEHNLMVFQPVRWDKLLHKAIRLGEENKLSPDYVTSFFKLLHDASIEEQAVIINSYEK